MYGTRSRMRARVTASAAVLAGVSLTVSACGGSSGASEAEMDGEAGTYGETLVEDGVYVGEADNSPPAFGKITVEDSKVTVEEAECRVKVGGNVFTAEDPRTGSFEDKTDDFSENIKVHWDSSGDPSELYQAESGNAVYSGSPDGPGSGEYSLKPVDADEADQQMQDFKDECPDMT